MGFAMSSLNFPIAKGTSGITFLTEKETYLGEEDQCISCARCANTCAMHLSPVMMLRSLKENDVEKAKRFGLMDCIECGCCAYVCPAHIKIVQRIRLGKALVRAKIAAERAKQTATVNAAAKPAENAKVAEVSATNGVQATTNGKATSSSTSQGAK